MEVSRLLDSSHGDHLKEVSRLLGSSHGDHPSEVYRSLGSSHGDHLREVSRLISKYFKETVVPLYPTRPGDRTGSEDVDQFYHIYIFEYCRNKCRIIISIKKGPPFCHLTLSFNMACMPFQHYLLQNIIKIHLHK